MPHSYYNLYYHLIWHTKDNLPYLQGEINHLVLEHIHQVCKEKSIEVKALNTTENHVHLLIGLRKWQNIPDLMWQIKGKSSYDIKKFPNLNLEWQTGYTVFTVSEKEVDKIIDYINNQEEHHRFLKK